MHNLRQRHSPYHAVYFWVYAFQQGVRALARAEQEWVRRCSYCWSHAGDAASQGSTGRWLKREAAHVLNEYYKHWASKHTCVPRTLVSAQLRDGNMLGLEQLTSQPHGTEALAFGSVLPRSPHASAPCHAALLCCSISLPSPVARPAPRRRQKRRWTCLPTALPSASPSTAGATRRCWPGWRQTCSRAPPQARPPHPQGSHRQQRTALQLLLHQQQSPRSPCPLSATGTTASSRYQRVCMQGCVRVRACLRPVRVRMCEGDVGVCKCWHHQLTQPVAGVMHGLRVHLLALLGEPSCLSPHVCSPSLGHGLTAECGPGPGSWQVTLQVSAASSSNRA